jgi:hypothetical protein
MRRWRPAVPAAAINGGGARCGGGGRGRGRGGVWVSGRCINARPVGEIST